MSGMVSSSGQIVTAVRRAVVVLANQGAVFARQHGMTLSDIRALIALNDLRRAGTAATPGALGRELGMASASTTQVIDRLERGGLVARSPDPSDRRRVLLEVTAAASASGIANFGALLEDVRKLADRRTPHEQAVILAFLADLADLSYSPRPSGAQRR